MSDQEIPKKFPALKEGEPTKTFIVSPHCMIGDNDDNLKKGGDEIELSHGQAVYLMNKGQIILQVPEFEADEPVANTEKGGNGSDVVAEGDARVDAAPSSKDAPKKKLNL